MPPSDRRMKIKLFHLAQGRADGWQAARRYLSDREAAALAVDLALERHDLMHAEARARDCTPCPNCGVIQSYEANHTCPAPQPSRDADADREMLARIMQARMSNHPPSRPLPEREQT